MSRRASGSGGGITLPGRLTSTGSRASPRPASSPAGEVALLDPLAPPEDATDVWERLDESPPTVVVVLKPDHVRDVDLFVERYGARAYGPDMFFAGDAPKTELDWIGEGSELPGGL